jgi:hypothetical protein
MDVPKEEGYTPMAWPTGSDDSSSFRRKEVKEKIDG